MIEIIMLDASPLGKLAHPAPKPDIMEWYRSMLRARARIIVPEIADYEVRRSLMLAGRQESVDLLNNLKAALVYQPITTTTMLKAAELWADAAAAANRPPTRKNLTAT